MGECPSRRPASRSSIEPSNGSRREPRASWFAFADVVDEGAGRDRLPALRCAPRGRPSLRVAPRRPLLAWPASWRGTYLCPRGWSRPILRRCGWNGRAARGPGSRPCREGRAAAGGRRARKPEVAVAGGEVIDRACSPNAAPAGPRRPSSAGAGRRRGAEGGRGAGAAFAELERRLEEATAERDALRPARAEATDERSGAR